MIYTIDFIRGLASSFSDVRIDNISDFIQDYTKILEIDDDTPVFSRTSKYKSFPKKHFKKKANHVIVRGESNFRLFTPNSDIERIQQSIRGTLNKINDSNSKRIIEELLTKISQFNSIEALDILAIEVHKKIIFDKQFQDIYIDLCYQIWSMQEWHDQLVTIVENEGELYWGRNYNDTKDDTTLHGPFSDEQSLRANSRHIVNFRYTLLTLLQVEFNRREEYLETIEDRFKAKRYIVAIIEFITKLYKKGYISQVVVHTMFFDILGIDKLDNEGKPILPSEPPHDIFVEAFITGWKIVLKRRFEKNYIDQYLNYIGRVLSGYNWNNRMRFMIEDILSKRTISLPTPTKSWAKVAKRAPIRLEYGDIERLVCVYRKGAQLTDVLDKLRGVNHRDLMEVVLNAALDQPDDVDLLVILIGRINVMPNIKQDVFNEFLANISDIKIDIPKASELMEYYKSLFVI